MAPRQSPGNPIFSSTGEPRRGPDVVSPGLRREERSPPSTCWLHSCQCPEGTWPQFHIAPIRTPRSFSTKLLSRQPACSTYWCTELLPPQCTTLHLPVLNSLRFPSTRLSSPICQVPLNTSPVLQHINLCPANLTVPTVQIVKSHSFHFWEVSLVTSCQLDFVLLIISLWAQWESQFFTHFHSVVHLLSSYLTNLAIRLLWGTMSKAVLKLRYTTFSAFPLFTELVISTERTTSVVRYDFALNVVLG